jgi:hypothetical protein
MNQNLPGILEARAADVETAFSDLGYNLKPLDINLRTRLSTSSST